MLLKLNILLCDSERNVQTIVKYINTKNKPVSNTLRFKVFFSERSWQNFGCKKSKGTVSKK